LLNHNIPQEIASKGEMGHAMASITAISSPLNLFSETIGDHTIFYMSVPATWGLSVMDIFLYGGLGLIVWTAIAIFGTYLWFKFTSPHERYGGEDTMEEQIETKRSMDEEAEYWRKYKEIERD